MTISLYHMYATLADSQPAYAISLWDGFWAGSEVLVSFSNTINLRQVVHLSE